MSIVSPMNGRAVGGTATINIDIRFWKYPLPALLVRRVARWAQRLRGKRPKSGTSCVRSSWLGPRPPAPGAETLHDLPGWWRAR